MTPSYYILGTILLVYFHVTFTNSEELLETEETTESDLGDVRAFNDGGSAHLLNEMGPSLATPGAVALGTAVIVIPLTALGICSFIADCSSWRWRMQDYFNYNSGYNYNYGGGMPQYNNGYPYMMHRESNPSIPKNLAPPLPANQQRVMVAVPINQQQQKSMESAVPVNTPVPVLINSQSVPVPVPTSSQQPEEPSGIMGVPFNPYQAKRAMNIAAYENQESANKHTKTT